MQETHHQVTVDGQKSVTVSGVEGVLSFSETKITLSILGSRRLHLEGSGLKILGFSKENGNFTASGAVHRLSYGGKGFGLFK
jgi:hypothetical protein